MQCLHEGLSGTELDFTSHIYPADSILRAVHLVVPPGYPDWKPLKLLDLEFANSIPVPERTHYNQKRLEDKMFQDLKFGVRDRSIVCKRRGGNQPEVELHL